jgi:hypothetical protein
MHGRIDTWYLPVTEAVASAFVDDAIVPDTPIERAAVLAMTMAAERPLGRGDMFRLVSEARAVFHGLSRPDGDRDLLAARAALNGASLDDISGRLGDQDTTFASFDVMAAGAWRGADGGFSHAFQAACRETFMDVSVRLDEDTTDFDEDEDDTAFLTMASSSAASRCSTFVARRTRCVLSAPLRCRRASITPSARLPAPARPI